MVKRMNSTTSWLMIGLLNGIASFAVWADELPGDEAPHLIDFVEGRVHHVQMHLVHTEQTLESGWVRMSQCHRDMAPTGRSSVGFHPERIRNLRLTGIKKIGKSWIGKEGASIEMEDIGQGNEVCFEGELRAVYWNGDQYHQKSGPYFLRFLDGYFPLKLDLMMDSEKSDVRVSAVEPDWVPYRLEAGRLKINLLFEGKLTLDFVLAEER